MEKQPCVYIMTNQRNGTLYVGVTSNLLRRVEEHKSDRIEGFTKRYQLHVLVYAEVCESMEQAISREKQLKGGSRKKKIDLIEQNNPTWKDITDSV